MPKLMEEETWAKRGHRKEYSTK